MVDPPPLTRDLVQIVEIRHAERRRKFTTRTEDFDVLKVLEDRVIGKALVQFFNSGGTFDSNHQRCMVDILARALYRKYMESWLPL